MIRSILARANVATLRRKIHQAEVRKSHIKSRLDKLNSHFEHKHLSKEQFNHHRKKLIEGRTLEEWIEYYDNYIQYCKRLIKRKEHEHRKKRLILVFSLIAFILTLSSLAFFSGPSFVGLSIQDTALDSPITGDSVSSPESNDTSSISTPDLDSGALSSNDSRSNESEEAVSNETTPGPIEEALEETLNKTEVEINETEVVTNETVVDTNETEVVTNETVVDTNETEVPLDETEEIAEENITIEERINESDFNVTEVINEADINVTTLQYSAILGRPVKWKKIVNLEEVGNAIITIPTEAENISVKKRIEREAGSFGASGDFEGFEDARFLMTGRVVQRRVGAATTADESWIVRFFRNLIGSFTGRVIQEIEEGEIIEEQELEINDSAKVYEIEYETAAPYSKETALSNGKRVEIVGPDSVHYENVLSFVELNNSLKIKDVSNIQIKWVEEKKTIPISYYEDLDGDGNIDYIEWVVPHLSNQTFEIILITKAVLLDENKTFIRDIYDLVKEKDDNWTAVEDGNWVRVTFEKNLTNEKDITLYARSNLTNATVEVYHFNSTENIVNFSEISEEGYYQVLLTEMQGSHQVFDLKILGGIEIDLIIDPIFDEVPAKLGWNKSYTGSGYGSIADDVAEDVVTDSNDLVYVVGWGDSLVGRTATNTGEDWWIKKFWPNGTEFTSSDNWNKTFDYKQDHDRAQGVAVDSKDNVYVVGFATNTSSKKDWWVKKFLPNGTEYTTAQGWNKTLHFGNGPTAGGDDEAWSVAVNDSDFVFAVGYGTNTTFLGNAGTGRDAITYGWDENGSNVQSWISGFDWGGNYAQGRDEWRDLAIQNGTTNNVMVVGFGEGAVIQGVSQDDWVVWYWNKDHTALLNTGGSCSGGNGECLDSNGGNVRDRAHAVKKDIYGDFYVVGETDTTGGGTTNWGMRRYGGQNGLWDSAPTIVHDHAGSNYNDVAYEITIDSDNNKWVVGQVDTTGTPTNNWHVRVWNSSDVVIFNETYRHGDSMAYGTWNDSIGDVYVVGYGTDLEGSSTDQDWWLKKFVGLDVSGGEILFVDPTPDNHTNVSGSFVPINVTISERNLKEINLDWNDTNYTIIDEDLIAFFNFENNTFLNEHYNRSGSPSQEIKDNSIYGNNASADDIWSFSNLGKYGKGIHFDYSSSNAAYIMKNGAGLGDLNTSYSGYNRNVSLVAWIYPENLSSLGLQGLVSNGEQSWEMGIWNTTTQGGCVAGDLYFGPANSTKYNCSNVTLKSGAWQHVVAVQSEDQESKLYINGREVTGQGPSGTLVSIIGNGTKGNVSIGRSLEIQSPGARNRYTGGIDELMIFKKKLSEDEVHLLYRTSLTRKNPDDWYMFINKTWETTEVFNSTDSNRSIQRGLGASNYTFQIWTNDTKKNDGHSELRYTWVVDTDVTPKISFVAPTHDNDNKSVLSWFPVNVSIEASSLVGINYTWNGTNYSILSEEVLGLYNFDNRSVLGEDSNDFKNLYRNKWHANCLGSACPIINTTNFVSGYSLTFDGSNDYVNISDGSSRLSSGWAIGKSNFTIKGSFKAETAHNGRIFSWDDGLGSDYLYIKLKDDASLEVGWNVQGACQSTHSYGGGLYADGEWHTFLVSYSSKDDAFTIYVDGVGDQSPSLGCGSVAWQVTEDIEIGGDPDIGPSEYFNGEIDEIMIYNGTSINGSSEAQRFYITKYDSDNWGFFTNQTLKGRSETNWKIPYANWTYQAFAKGDFLNATEERGIWPSADDTSPKVHFMSPTLANQSESLRSFEFKVNIEDDLNFLGLIKYNYNGTNYTTFNISQVNMMYTFDNQSVLGENDTLVVDIGEGLNSPFSTNLTCVGATCPTFNATDGKYDGTFDFNGSQYFSGDVNFDDNWGIDDPFAIEMWVKMKAGEEDSRFFSADDSDDGPQDAIYLESQQGGNLGFYVIGNSGCGVSLASGPNPLTDNAWHHLVAVYNGTGAGNGGYLYVDGVAHSNSGGDCSGADTLDITGQVYFGADPADGAGIGGIAGLNGSIDSFTMWERDFTPEEVKILYFDNLKQVGSSNYTYYVNHTLNDTYEYPLENGNLTYYVYSQDDFENSNQTENRWVDIISSSASAPQIFFVEEVTGQIPIEGYGYDYSFKFNVSDSNGFGDLNDGSATANITFGDNSRVNSSCVHLKDYDTNNAEYECSVRLFWFDEPSAWTINITIEDSGGLLAINSTRSVTPQLLHAWQTVLPWDGAFSWSTDPSPLDIDQKSEDNPYTINNTGNVGSLGINVTAFHLRGQDTISEFIYAENFTFHLSDTCSGGTQLQNETQVVISGAVLNNGSNEIEELYLCLQEVPQGITAQTYDSSAYGAWIISTFTSVFIFFKQLLSSLGIIAFVVAIKPRKRREDLKLMKAVSLVMDVVKRNNGLGEAQAISLLASLIRGEKGELEDELLGSVRIIIESARKDLGLDEHDLMKLFVDKLGRKWGLDKDALRKASGREISHISLSVFSTEIGGLEAIVKYMKENLRMDYPEIASELNRDYKTIWTAYNKAVEKKKTEIEVDEKERIKIPLSIFKNRNLTIFEALVLYLKNVGMRYSEIGDLLNRDQRNMWTICSRAKKKITVVEK